MGVAPVAIRVALAGYGPGQVALLRFGMASVLLVVYGAFAGLRRPALADLPALLLAGAVGSTIYNVVLNYGLRTVPAATASFLVASTPIWTSLMAVRFLKERLNRVGWLGILASFVGIGLISRERGHGLHVSPGAILIGLNAIAYAVYIILQKRLLRRFNALEFTTYSFWGEACCCCRFGEGSLAALRTATPNATWGLVFLGIFPAPTSRGRRPWPACRLRASAVFLLDAGSHGRDRMALAGRNPHGSGVGGRGARVNRRASGQCLGARSAS